MAQSEIASRTSRIIPLTSSRRRRLDGKNRCRIFAHATAATVPKNVAMIDGAMIAVGCWRAGRGQDADHRRRDELHAGGGHGHERDHRIGRRVLVGIERLQLLHRLDAERRGGVVEAEHVRGDATTIAPDGRMIRRHLRETAGADRPQRPPEQRHQPGRLGDAHDAQP